VGGIVPFEGRAKGQHGSTPVHAKERVPQHEIRPADGVWIWRRPEQLGGARPQNPDSRECRSRCYSRCFRSSCPLQVETGLLTPPAHEAFSRRQHQVTILGECGIE
jgi:hypothetical protein